MQIGAQSSAACLGCVHHLLVEQPSYRLTNLASVTSSRRPTQGSGAMEISALSTKELGLLPGRHDVVQRLSVVRKSTRLAEGIVRSTRISREKNNASYVAESQQQQLRNNLLRIGMVISCPLIVTTATSGSAVALEAHNEAAIMPAMSDNWISSFIFDLLHTGGAPLADLDPATAKLAITVLGPFFAFFNLLFIFRIVMSWYPQIPVSKFPFILAYAPTEPILGPTRRLIPPVGGVDVAPVIWVALMSFLNEILLGKQGLFILLSQQQS